MMKAAPQLTITDFRKQMRAGGLMPIPVNGKKPVLDEWQKKTKVSDREIELWEKDFPTAQNTGLLTCKMPTLDADIMNQAAAEAVEALVRKRFQDRGAVLVRIGRAPRRAIPFRTNKPFEKITVRLIAADGAPGEKIELLADGQQVVGFGIHPDTNKPYAWDTGGKKALVLEELPLITETQARELVDDVVNLLTEKFGYIRAEGTHKNKSNGEFKGAYPPATREEIQAALDATPSDDYEIWYQIGCALGNELGEDAFALFQPWSEKSEKYNKRKCANQWKACEKKVAKGSRYGAGTIFHYASQADPNWRAKYEDEKLQRVYAAGSEQAPKNNSKPETKPAINATPWSWVDPTQVPLRAWLYRPSYIRKFASATIAHSKVGKSAKVMVEALGMATGKALLGVPPDGKLRVWYWNGEDPKEELDRRLAAACLHHRITKADLGNRLFVDSGRTMPIVIAEGDKTGTRIAVPVIEQVIATLRASKIDVLIIDPFVACHRVSENDNRGIETVAKSWAQIAEVTNCAVMLVHHSRKTYGEDVTAESSRGASALVAAVRAVQVLNVMSSREADDLCIEEDQRRRYLRSDNSEANMARPAATAIWYRIESVKLGNAPLDGGDDVGVATPWYPPASKATTADNELHAWQAVKAGGPWRESSQSKKEPWVGEAIAQALNLELRFKGNEKTVRTLIAQGLEKGWLKRVEKHDNARRIRTFIEAAAVPPASAPPKSSAPPK
jgi:AAA domain/Primase C terminal 2 (PriCT-2)/Bifunctional DNA primase/polymerase, N-terminal